MLAAGHLDDVNKARCSVYRLRQVDQLQTLSEKLGCCAFTQPDMPQLGRTPGPWVVQSTSVSPLGSQCQKNREAGVSSVAMCRYTSRLDKPWEPYATSSLQAGI